MFGRELLSSNQDDEMRAVTDKAELAGRTEDKYLDQHSLSKRNVKQEVLDFLNSKQKLPDDLVPHIKSAKTDYDLNRSKLLAPKREHTTLDGIGARDPILYEEKPQHFPKKQRKNYEL